MNIEQVLGARECRLPTRIGSVGIVLLATQRSGSTMIASDLNTASVFGRCDEHFLPVLKNLWKRGSNKNFNIDFEDYEEKFLDRGLSECGDVFSIKLMDDHMSPFGAWQLDIREVERMLEMSNPAPHLAAAGLLRFGSRFDRTIVIKLTRKDVFAIARSRLKARRTKLYHDVGSKSQINKAIKQVAIPNAALLREMAKVCASYEFIERTVSMMGRETINIDFDYAASAFPDYLEPVITGTGKQPSLSNLKRRTKKITSADELEDAKAKFLRTLGF